jgi:hypothetical protein
MAGFVVFNAVIASGRAGVALLFLDFEFGLVVMGIDFAVEHADQQVLLMHIPDADTGGYAFVGHV